MTWNCRLELKISIEGPILCSVPGASSLGVDQGFNRNFKDSQVINASHLKGKLREALKELKKLGVIELDPNKWLGSPTGDDSPTGEGIPKEEKKGDGKPNRGRIHFSELVPEEPLKEQAEVPIRNRIAIDRESGAVKHQAFLMFEDLFPAGKTYVWKGSLEFVAGDEKELKEIPEDLIRGLRWITNFGAEKTIGFGRVKSVEVDTVKKEIKIEIPPGGTTSGGWFELEIKPLEPLLLMGPVKKTNYIASEEHIRGNVIKGALARRMNELANEEPGKEIDKANEKVSILFPTLAENFEGLRFTHAFPCAVGRSRPQQIPMSVVLAEGDTSERFFNLALLKDACLIEGKYAPLFQIDWKSSSLALERSGWSTPLKLLKTRTAIHAETRRALENNLFTYEYVCPCDFARNPLIWKAYASLPEGLDREKNAKLAAELKVAFEQLKWLGKEDGSVKCSLNENQPPAEDFKPVNDQYFIVTLQSDAVMLDPKDLIGKEPKLESLYSKFWMDIMDISEKKLKLFNFFAWQKLAGGYMNRRFQQGKAYYPYYLTGANSVFVFQVKDVPAQEAIRKILHEWVLHGLPLPSWADKEYSGNNKEYGGNTWKNCPYVPQNGFGEIAVNNGPWHSSYAEMLEPKAGGGIHA